MRKIKKPVLGLTIGILALACFTMLPLPANAEDVVRVNQPCNLVDGAFTIAANGNYNVNNSRVHHDWDGVSLDIGGGYEQPGVGTIYHRCKDYTAIASIAGTIKIHPNDECGNPYTEILGANGISVSYVHMDYSASNTAQNGTVVKVGDVVGTISKKGCANFNHIHFNVLKNGVRQGYAHWELVPTPVAIPKASIKNPAPEAYVNSLAIEIETLNNPNLQYRVQVARDSSFANIVYDNTNTGTLHYPNFKNGGEYYIRAQIKDNNNSGSWSDVRKVFMRTTPATVSYIANNFVEVSRNQSGKLIIRTSTDSLNWVNWVDHGGGKGPVTLITFSNKLYLFMVGDDGSLYYKSTVDGLNWSTWVHDTSLSIKNRIDAVVVNNRLVITVTKVSGHVNTRFTENGETWSNWKENGGTNESVVSQVLGGKLYQSVIGLENILFTRTSNDGENWTDWVNTNKPAKFVNLQSTPDKLFEVITQPDNKVATRYYNAGGNWSDWSVNGGTRLQVSMAYFNNTVYQSLLGVDNKGYIRRLEGNNWTPWSQRGGGLSEVNIYSAGGKLHQTISDYSAKVWHRFTDDGIFDYKPEDWEVKQKYEIADKISSASINGIVVQATRNKDNTFMTRYSMDGTDWSDWSISGGGTGKVSLVYFNNRLYQFVVGLDKAIWSRATIDGINWENWEKDNTGITTTQEIDVISDKMYLHQTITTTAGKINTRLKAATPQVGSTNWTNWYENGGSNRPVESLFVWPDQKLYQAVSASDNKVYVRFFDYESAVWSPWVPIGKNSTFTPELVYYNGKINIHLVNSSGKLELGYMDANSQWTGWTVSEVSGLTFTTESTTAVFNNIVTQSILTNNGVIQTRYLLSNNNWSPWVAYGGGKYRVDLFAFENKALIQSIVGGDDYSWVRKSEDGVFDRTPSPEDTSEYWRI